MTKAELLEKVAYLNEQMAHLEEQIAHLEGRPEGKNAATFKFGVTVAIGIFIPLLSLAMSYLAGKLAGAGYWELAGFAAGVGGSVLAVSLNHLAWAIEDITRSEFPWNWLLAIALDSSLVLGELCHVYAPPTLGLGVVCWVVMVAVCGFSMALNVFAFLFHEKAVKPVETT